MIMHRVRSLGNRLASEDVLDVFAVENPLVRTVVAAVAEPQKTDPWPNRPGLGRGRYEEHRLRERSRRDEAVDVCRRGVAFWSAALGFPPRESIWDAEFMMPEDPLGRRLPLSLQLTDQTSSGPVRVHLDLEHCDTASAPAAQERPRPRDDA
jgi:hypothetical protein